MRATIKEGKFGREHANAVAGKLRSDSLSIALKFQKQGDYAKAQLVYRQILTDDPDDVDALFDFGRLAQNLKQHHIAIAVFSKIIEIDHTYCKVFFQRGHMHSLNKNYNLAISDCLGQKW